MRPTSLLFLAGALAPAAWALPSETSHSYVLTGQILIYPQHMNDLGSGFVLAPRGALRDADHLLEVSTPAVLVRDGDAVLAIDSGRLAPASAPLVAALRGTTLELGVPELHVQAGEWALYGTSEDMLARPILTLSGAAQSLRQISDVELAFSGELLVHEAFAAEIGLPQLANRPVGAFTLVAGTYPGLAPLAATAQTAVAPGAGTQGGTMNLTVPGPDVIVSTVGSTSSTTITKNGTVGAISAYSMTTVSCNIGTANAIWIDCTNGGANCNQHPVIGQTLYRLKSVGGATRFEQVGMSWLKHGFCAADAQNQTTCPGTYAPNGSCDWLGLFATDTYGAGLNGSQPDLGPRSEVNAWTGYFPYPYGLNWNLSGDAIYKRLQVKNADLDPAQNAGATYYAEVQYVCTDEPEGNRYNNTSWRPVTNGGANGQTLAFTAGTVQQQPAIQAWALNDAGVTLTDIDVPADGRFVLGSKVTDLGGGQYHYEYALYNMNNNDSARSFSVPLPGVVSATNLGFHDVDYHSGELYALTDWPGVIAGGAVEWSTDTFNTDPNANALRWSTTYNFRFDADSPPVTGTITIGLFKTGQTIQVQGPVPTDPGAPFCFGDGSGAACPCGNSGAAGNGCGSSVNANGANLAVSGAASLSSDSLLLSGSGMPNSSALYFQGTSQQAGGAGVAFGDGLRCASGTIVRLKTVTNVGGASQYPGVGDLSVSVRGGVLAPGLRTYQVWYRNAAAFCTPSTFNLSNGYSITWSP